ncbi:MAG: hypothetical protein KZQ87_00240 [Candidatus Thiodiazotropha sp. (ex Cardiolucina cf. quadrata)]|nr:hypothetical protein [Candidatus Thiodiazotropha sp. (ex Cardiolucina cf. quadrata)]
MSGATNNDAVSETQLKELLLHEERKSERYANYARLLLTFLYFAVGLGIRQELPAHSFNAIISASLINLIYGIFVFFKLKDPNPPSWIKYPSVSIDILLLSIVIYSFGTFRTFKAVGQEQGQPQITTVNCKNITVMVA